MLGKPSRRTQQRLEQHGKRAMATVLEVSGGMAITAGNPAIVSNTEVTRKLRLRVEPENEQAFEVETKMRFPQMAAPFQGVRLPVIYDPKDPGTVMLDQSAGGVAGATLPGMPAPTEAQVDEDRALREMALGGASPDQMLERITEIRAAAGEPSPQVIFGSQQVAQPAAQSDPVDQLTKLAELRDKGVLTEEEFAAQKARILGGG